MGLMHFLGFFLLILGMVLICIEVFIPGFGLPGIAGILCTLSGIFTLARNPKEGIIYAVIVVVILAVMLAVSISLLNSKKTKSPIRLETELSGKNLFIEGKDMEYLIGEKGIAMTDLRPSGKGEFDGVRFDVISENGYMKKGTSLIITEVKNNIFMVKEEK